MINFDRAPSPAAAAFAEPFPIGLRNARSKEINGIHESERQAYRPMTTIYFVRHCQSKAGWRESDRIRPLTERGQRDSAFVTLALKDVPLDYCVCSPYTRSLGTIRDCARDHGLEIHTDERFGERVSGRGSDERALVMRWADHAYSEPGGESIADVQKRNIEGLHELLAAHDGAQILFGTHGTALSAILDYYEPDFGLDGFYKLYAWMPYIIKAAFDGTRLVSREDLLIVNRGY